MGNCSSTTPTPEEQHAAAVREFVSEAAGRAARAAMNAALERAHPESSSASGIHEKPYIVKTRTSSSSSAQALQCDC
jgi:hypothetical protein